MPSRESSCSTRAGAGDEDESARAACSRFAGGHPRRRLGAITASAGQRSGFLQDFTELRDVADAVLGPTRRRRHALSTGSSRRPRNWGGAEAAAGDSARPDGPTPGAGHPGRSLAQSGRRQRRRLSVDLSDAALYRPPGATAGPTSLKDIAAKSGGRFYRTPGGSQFARRLRGHVEELRSQTRLTYEPSERAA